MLILTFGFLPSYQSLKALGCTPSAPPRKTNIVTSTGFARRTRVAARIGSTPSASVPAAAAPAVTISRRVSFLAPAACSGFLIDAPFVGSRISSLLQHHGAARRPTDLDAVAGRDRCGRVVWLRRHKLPSVGEPDAIVDVGAVEDDVVDRRVEDVPARPRLERRRDRDPLRP